MNNFVDIELWNKKVGTLFWDKDKSLAVFEYEKKYLQTEWDIAPIIMPLKSSQNQVYEFAENKNNCFRGLPGLVADSLPDAFGNQIIDQWFASQGLPSNECTPIDRLCYVGKRAMGALEFIPSEDHGLDSSSSIQINELTELAKMVLNKREEFCAHIKEATEPILDILKVGTSAGGAKPKAIIAYNAKTGEVKSGQVKAPKDFGYYLLKFDGVEDLKISDNPMGIGKIEYAYYKMALDCNILMTESRLLKEGEYRHFMTKRFDRLENGEKLHMQTLAAIAHYNRDQQYSYEQAFQIIRKLKLPYSDQEQFFRRMVFNVMARNHDDHTKNHSFLMNQKGEWQLAPAYDLSYSYSSTGRWTNQHQMSLNGKRDNFEYSDLATIGNKMGILRFNDIINQIADVVSRWKEYAVNAEVREDHISQIEKNLLILHTANK